MEILARTDRLFEETELDDLGVGAFLRSFASAANAVTRALGVTLRLFFWLAATVRQAEVFFWRSM